jgi:hypothetical protein
VTSDLERLISEIVDEHAADAIAEAEANYAQREQARKEADEKLAKVEREAKAEAERKAREVQVALERKQAAERALTAFWLISASP